MTTATPTPSPGQHQPLAERLRPPTLGAVVGQQHVLGPGMPLRLAFESRAPPRSPLLLSPPAPAVGRAAAPAHPGRRGWPAACAGPGHAAAAGVRVGAPP